MHSICPVGWPDNGMTNRRKAFRGTAWVAERPVGTRPTEEFSRLSRVRIGNRLP